MKIVRGVMVIEFVGEVAEKREKGEGRGMGSS
jgi:hypothetical protein